MAETDLKVFRTSEELYSKTALALVRNITELSPHRGRIHIGVTGGAIAFDLIPKMAAIMESHPDIVEQWAPIHLWMIEENFVERDNPHRLDTLIERELASKFDNVTLHRPPTPSTASTAYDAAEAYEEHMVTVYSLSSKVDPRAVALDFCLLGIGEDGHLASLFASHDTLEATGLFTAEVDAPRPPKQRITMTIPALRRSRASWFVVSGANKAYVLAHALQGANYREVPAASMNQVGTKWWVDRDAAARVDIIFEAGIRG